MITDKVRITERHLDTGRIYIVDGLIDGMTVTMIHELCRRLPFARSEYATGEDGDMPSLNANFNEASLSSNPMLRRFRDTVVTKAHELFPQKDWVLDRVHCNAQARDDFQQPHPDLKRGITALYYVNAHWPEKWQGETLFHDSSGEPAAAVALKPGRLVVFNADIIHRGGVPAFGCDELRLSIAFKFAAPK